MTEPSPATRTPIRRWVLGGLLALVPIVPIVIALLVTGAHATHPATGGSTGRDAAATSAARSSRSDLPAGRGTLVGILTRPTAMARRPGGPRVATLATHTSYGSPESVSVRRVDGRWLGVVNVAAGNNRLGWIRMGRGVGLIRDQWSIHAQLARHELVVQRLGRTVRRYVVAVGKPSAPTPTGDFAVTDRLTTGEPLGPYGCCILATSATAPHAISDWDGGNRIAIHSTPAVSTIGQSVSHGCIHVTDAEGRWLITHIPLGTPVIVSSA